MIPVRNGGEDLRRCLEAIERQRVDQEVEVVVMDSASTDGSAERARSRGAKVETIALEDFNHGGTRNLGAGLASGETLVFTSQDAYPADDQWLARLTAPLADEGDGVKGVAGVYGRQVAHEGARPPERYFLDFLYGPEPRRQRAAGPEQLSMDTTLFSNVTSAIPKRIWDQFRFAEDMIMTEDQEWAARVLLAGFDLVYEPAAVVHHSHPYSIRQAFRRFFDSGASAERAFLPAGGSGGAPLRRNSWDYGRGEIAWLWREGHRRWIPYALAYEGAKFAGLQLGARHRRLPLRLKRAFSAQPAYWGSPKRELGAGPPELEG